MFDFNDATDNVGKFLSPGVHTLQIKEITDGVAGTGAPFIEMVLEDKAGLVCNQRYYLNTVAKEGSKQSAWDITKPALVNLLAAINKTDFDTAKGKLPAAKTPAELSSSLAKIIVGKPFDVRLNGKEIAANGPDKKNWIKAEIGGGKCFAPAGSNTLTFDPTKHVKMLNGLPLATTSTNNTNTPVKW